MTAIAHGSLSRMVYVVAAVFIVATVFLFRTKPEGPAIGFRAGISIEEIQRGMDLKALPVALVYDYF